MNPVEQLTRLLESGLLSDKNSERIARVFCDATKIVYERQKRLNKPILKMKQVSSALLLAETLHSQAFRFEATGTLAENFGKFSEASALAYYETKVMGSAQDKHGRALSSLTKTASGLYTKTPFPASTSLPQRIMRKDAANGCPGFAIHYPTRMPYTCQRKQSTEPSGAHTCTVLSLRFQ